VRIGVVAVVVLLGVLDLRLRRMVVRRYLLAGDNEAHDPSGSLFTG